MFSNDSKKDQTASQNTSDTSTPNIFSKSFSWLCGNKKRMIFALAIFCILSLGLSYFVGMNIPFDKIPLVSSGMKNSVEELNTARASMKADLPALDAEVQSLKSSMSKENYDIMKDLIKAGQSCIKYASITNLNQFTKAANAAHKADSSLGASYAFIDAVLISIEDSLESVGDFLLMFMLLSLFVSALGGLFLVRWLVIIGLLLSVIYSFLFLGLIAVLLFAASHIALFVYICKYRKEAHLDDDDEYEDDEDE
jgi:ABC-type multidrug transport system fused ATPase/permease subunit